MSQSTTSVQVTSSNSADDSTTGRTQKAPRKTRRLFDDSQGAELRRRYEAGETVESLAAEHNCTRFAIEGAIRRAGGKLGRGGANLGSKFGADASDDQKKQMVDLYRSGKTFRQVGGQVGLHGSQVRRFLQSINEPLRRRGQLSEAKNLELQADGNTVAGVCPACGILARLWSRGLCSKCYHNPEARQQHQPLRTRDDLTGKTFGRLTALEPVGDGYMQRSHWRCLCACGAETQVAFDSLTSGNTMSCGCFQREGASKRFKTHGGSNTPLYRIWHAMIDRCYREADPDYRHYGGRGITVAEKWRESFAAFREDVGERPSPKHSLDRADNEKGYEPGNMRWATKAEQNRNTRVNVVIEHGGERRTVAEWCELIGLDHRRVCQRLKQGMPVEKALFTGDHRESSGAGAFLSSEAGTYYAMLRRCTRTDDPAYPNYGGRGISIDSRWLGKDGLANFLEDMGARPTKDHMLDRANNDGNYSRENCRWVTRTENARNTRHNRRLTLGEESLCVSEWSERTGIPSWKIRQRLDRGWTVERALTT